MAAFPTHVSGSNFTANSIVISGIFTIDVPVFNFLNCANIQLRTNAKINIPAAKTFGINSSNLHAACSNMWDGIYINGATAHLSITNGSLIYDAKNGVVSINGGDFNIENSSFINDLKGIQVLPYAGNHTGRIVGTTIKTQGVLLPALPAYAPTINKTLFGIQITDNALVNVGDPALNAYQNLFTNIYQGISSQNSNTVIYNCNFQTITTAFFVFNSGTAILDIGSNNNVNSITVGGSGSFKRCLFNDVNIGLDTKNQTNVSMGFNNLLRVHSYGIRCQGSPGANMTLNIISNYISNVAATYPFNTGILITEVYGANVNIYTNTILQKVGNPLTFGTGIRVSLATPGSVNLTIAFNQNMQRLVTGIWLQNLTGTQTEFVENNIITFPNANIAYAVNPHYGIRLQNCATVRVRNNVVQKGGVNPTAIMRDFLRGVSIENSPGTVLSQNSFTRMGSGSWAYGICSGSSLPCNTFNNCYDGFYFTGPAFVCDIGEQVLDPSNGITPLPTGNTWTTSGNFDLAGAIDPAHSIHWYYGGTSPNPTNGLSAGSLTTGSTTLSGNTSACNVQFLAPIPVVARQHLTAQPVITPNSYNPGTQESMLARREAHRALRQNISWLHLNTPQDTLFSNFYTIADQSNIGLFRNFEDIGSCK